MLRFILPSFLLLCSCNNNKQNIILKRDLKDSGLKIIATGLPSLEAITQLNALSKKYDFSYCPIGCVVSERQMDSIQKENDLTYQILANRFGKDWRNKFNSQYAKINQIRLQADSIMTARFPQNDKFFNYLITPFANKNYYQVKVYGTDTLNGQTELVVYYKWTMSFGTRASIQILKTFEKL